MVERRPVTVEARCAADGTIIPLAITGPGRRRAVAVVQRQWGSGAWAYFDVRLKGGESTILSLERRSMRWYASPTRGASKMA